MQSAICNFGPTLVIKLILPKQISTKQAERAVYVVKYPLRLEDSLQKAWLHIPHLNILI